MKRILIWLPLMFLLAVSSALAVNLVDGKDPSLVATPVTGEEAPALDVPEFETSRHFTSADLKGKPRLLNFFASWCGPCAAESGVLMDLSSRHIVEIDGVALKDNADGLHEFLERRGNPYTKVGLDESGRTALEWGVTGVPETFAIDANGMVIARHIGELRKEDAQGLLNKLQASGR